MEIYLATLLIDHRIDGLDSFRKRSLSTYVVCPLHGTKLANEEGEIFTSS